MTPQEKAIKLRDSFLEHVSGINSWGHFDEDIQKQDAKNCAIILVDEILKSRPSLPKEAFGGAINIGECINLSRKYWSDVRKELESF